jgi:superfamily II DNA helicase RecQ
MEELEAKMMDSKREMQIADALDEIRTRNARIERGEKGVKEDEALDKVRYSLEEQKARQEQEDEEAARKAFEERNVWEARRAEEEAEVNSSIIKDGLIDEERETMPPPSQSFERVKRVKKPMVPGLVKKAEAPKQALASVVPKGLGLADYGSDSD